MEMPMKTEVMRLEDINPAPYNPRVTLTTSDAEWKALEASLNKHGLVVPLVVNKRTGNTLVSGHQRLNVLKAQGVAEAEVVVVDIDPGREKSLNYDLNKMEGKWDYGKLYDVISTLEENGCDFTSTGFAKDEIRDILSEIEQYTDDDLDGDAPESTPKKDDTEPGIRCRVGEYAFRMSEKAYDDMMADIHIRVGFVNKQTTNELKRRLLER